jgi:hypothetical protein
MTTTAEKLEFRLPPIVKAKREQSQEARPESRSKTPVKGVTRKKIIVE